MVVGDWVQSRPWLKAYVTVQLTELGMRLSGSIVPEATELLTNEGLTAL